jgi:hypothetical protein
VSAQTPAVSFDYSVVRVGSVKSVTLLLVGDLRRAGSETSNVFTTKSNPWVSRVADTVLAGRHVVVVSLGDEARKCMRADQEARGGWFRG